MESQRRPDFRFPQVLGNSFQDVVQIVKSVLVGPVVDGEEKLVVVILVQVIVHVILGDLLVHVDAKDLRSLIGPASGNILDRVATPAEINGGNSIREHMLACFSVSLDGQVEVAQFVLGEGVGSTLHDDNIGPVGVHAPVHHFFEKVEVDHIGDALFQWHIDCKVLADALAGGVQSPSAREEVLLKLMETDSHDSVGVVEGLLDSISVVDVDVQVEDSGVDLQQF